MIPSITYISCFVRRIPMFCCESLESSVKVKPTFHLVSIVKRSSEDCKYSSAAGAARRSRLEKSFCSQRWTHIPSLDKKASSLIRSKSSNAMPLRLIRISTPNRKTILKQSKLTGVLSSAPVRPRKGLESYLAALMGLETLLFHSCPVRVLFPHRFYEWEPLTVYLSSECTPPLRMEV